jgi:hypothetical protein
MSTEERDERERTEKPEVTDEHTEKAKEMAKAYDEERPTTTLPGSGGTVAGTAVNDWVDDEDKGKVDFSGQEEAKEEAEKASKREMKERREAGEFR